MLTLILIGALACLGGLLAYRAGKVRGERALPAAGTSSAARQLERTVKDVRVDDIVQHAGRDWLVEGIVQYDEDGHTWRAARAVDAPDERWWVIALERTGPPTVRVMSRAEGLPLTGYPPESISHAGVDYRLTQRGTASAVLSGHLSGVPGVPGAVKALSLRCRWWRYAAAGEKTLLVEQWGEEYRGLVGDLVKAEDVDLLSAS